MNIPKITNRPLIQLIENFWQWKNLWLATTCGFGALALIYVLFLKEDVWEASQGLIVRDEANGAVMRLGRFESQTAMKAAQETVVEMARNPQVLSDALTAVGRENSGLFWWWKSDDAPTTSEIQDLASNITVRAPQGAEFGTTEVIYLEVKATAQSRALALCEAVCDALENRLKQVRRARANGVISELLAAREAAAKNLDRSTEQLQQIEAAVGMDLSDLRGLTDATSNGSVTRQTLDTITSELRAADLTVQQISIDLQTAQESFADPEQLLETPTNLVNSQPGLIRLREGLAAATIATSQLSSRYTETHPLVIQAQETEERIRDELRSELGTAVATLTKDKQLAEARVQKLRDQQASLQDRIEKLAQVRAQYGNVASDVAARNKQMQNTERELASAEAARDASETSSLITRLEEPILGEKPIGPGRSVILLGSTAAGLFFGFGVVFLLAPVDGATKYGRRRQDFSEALGRRASDLRGNQSSGPTAAEIAQERGAAEPTTEADSVASAVAPASEKSKASEPRADSRSFAERASTLPTDIAQPGQTSVELAAELESENPSTPRTTAERNPSATPSSVSLASSPQPENSSLRKSAADSGSSQVSTPPRPAAPSQPATPPPSSSLKSPQGSVENPASLAEAQAVIAEALRNNLT